MSNRCWGARSRNWFSIFGLNKGIDWFSSLVFPHLFTKLIRLCPSSTENVNNSSGYRVSKISNIEYHGIEKSPTF